MFILDIIYIYLLPPGRVYQDPAPDRLRDIDGNSSSQKPTIVVKFYQWSVLVNLLSYWIPPCLIAQIVWQVHNPSPHLQLVKLHLIRPHAIIELR